MNINQSSLSRIEAGNKGCSVDMFIQFSEFFHVSLDSLILGVESSSQQNTVNYARLKSDITNLINQLTKLNAQL